MTRSEVQRLCHRLRNIAEPVLSHETWAATLFGVFIGLFVAWKSLPPATPSQAEHTAYLRGVYLASWILTLVVAAIFGSLAVGERRRQRKSEPSLIADELEQICDERMPDCTCSECGHNGCLLYPNIEIDDPKRSGEFRRTLICPRCSTPGAEAALVADALAFGHQLNDLRVFGSSAVAA